MKPVYADRSYRTMLGTAFYDRLGERGELESLLAKRKLTIVYGPRNVGKSELARYHLSKQEYPTVVVDARRLRAASPGERAKTITPLGGVPERIVDAVRKAVSSHPKLGILDIIIDVAGALRSILYRLSGLVILIDEFHQLPGYSMTALGEALGDLESLAALLTKNSGDIRVLVTVSEGFIATGEALRRLEGYSTGWLLVEHLDWPHFSALHEEYSRTHGCIPSGLEVYSLVGGTPGSLPDLCLLSREDLVRSKIRVWASIVETALSGARNRLEASGSRIEPRELIAMALRVMEEPVRPLESPVLYLLGEALVEYNVAYARLAGDGIMYLPQYPVYRVLLEEAVEEGAGSLLRLDPWKVYRRAMEKAQRLQEN